MNDYTVIKDGKPVIEGGMELDPCIELKEFLEERNPDSVVTVELIKKPSKYNFIDPT